ncbi:MAG: peptidylprolyl isomerase [Gammaproteobacteria bacterium]|nr:MAG: peptidylprolyl isomerase [Gammaproteobacteria bacterium]
MRIFATAILLLTASTMMAAEIGQIPAYPRVSILTSAGTIELELDGRRAPITVVNFLRYASEGAYDGSVFHRVIPGFMAQGGGYNSEFEKLPARGPIPNESGNGLRNARGTIAMARTADPHSGARQFYINLGDNPSLDPRTSGWGYAVFGQVVEGMEVLDRIAAIPTGPGGPFPGDVPQSTVTIEKIAIVQ